MTTSVQFSHNSSSRLISFLNDTRAKIKHTFSFPLNSKSQTIDTNDLERNIPPKIVESTEEVHINHWYDAFVRLFIWYPSYLPREERWLLFKLDIILLLYSCSSYFTKALDQSNLVKAYNSGMDKSINFVGNDYSYAKSIYSIGFVISMCFGMLIVTRPWARYALPILEVIWGVLTFCEGIVKSSRQMFAIRFLIGFMEGPVYPSIVYTIGSWYKRDELYRRMICFSVSSAIGTVFSGFLQSAAFHNLDGKAGYEGWQWGFFIDGIMTLPIALLGFIFYPGSLEQAEKVWWITKSEYNIAVNRMRKAGVQRTNVGVSWSLIKRVLFRWHAHFFALFLSLFMILELPDSTGLDLWLKAHSDQFSETQRVNYPSFQSVVSVVGGFLFVGLSDSFSPTIFLTIVQCLFIVSYSSLAYWDIPTAWRWICYLIIGLDSCDKAIISALITRVVRRDADERAFVIGYSGAVANAINIWTNIVFFPTSKAPEFHVGYRVSLVAAILMLFMPIGLWWLERWDERHYAVENSKITESSDELPSIDGSINEKTHVTERKIPTIEQYSIEEVSHILKDEPRAIEQNSAEQKEN